MSVDYGVLVTSSHRCVSTVSLPISLPIHIAIEFDSTLGYPGKGPPRVPDFGSMERCKRLRPRSMASITWRKCEKVREMQKHEKKRHGDGEMQGVCMENMRDVP